MHLILSIRRTPIAAPSYIHRLPHAATLSCSMPELGRLSLPLLPPQPCPKSPSPSRPRAIGFPHSPRGVPYSDVQTQDRGPQQCGFVDSGQLSLPGKFTRRRGSPLAFTLHPRPVPDCITVPIAHPCHISRPSSLGRRDRDSGSSAGSTRR